MSDVKSQFYFGAGLIRGVLNRFGRASGGTLVELEADLQRAREMGAPDHATIARTGRSSVYTLEVIWNG